MVLHNSKSDLPLANFFESILRFPFSRIIFEIFLEVRNPKYFFSTGSERVATFSATLWISYLVFATQRKHLKYQMEIFLVKLMEVVNNENNIKITYEHKELVLEMIVRLYKIKPNFITQLYVNYDCDLFTANIFEDLTKMLSKNAFPVTGLYSTQFLSLDALLTVVEAIEKQCQKKRIEQDQNATTDETIDKSSDDKTTPVVKCSSNLNTKGSGHIMGKHSSPDSYSEECKRAESESKKPLLSNNRLD